eukprot:768540-Hanusia_phi.AAC.6
MEILLQAPKGSSELGLVDNVCKEKSNFPGNSLSLRSSHSSGEKSFLQEEQQRKEGEAGPGATGEGAGAGAGAGAEGRTEVGAVVEAGGAVRAMDRMSRLGEGSREKAGEDTSENRTRGRESKEEGPREQGDRKAEQLGGGAGGAAVDTSKAGPSYIQHRGVCGSSEQAEAFWEGGWRARGATGRIREDDDTNVAAEKGGGERTRGGERSEETEIGAEERSV